MITKNLFVLILFFASACSTSVLYKEDSKNPPIREWSLIEKMEQEKWDIGQLKKALGEPNRQYQDPFFIVYDYDQPNHQKWGFKIGENQKIISITFIPNASNNEDFTLEQVMKKWGKTCVKKKEVDTSLHFIRNIYYLDCDKNHRAYFNRYDEVTNLAITVEPL